MVDDAGTVLVVLLLADPHLLEGGEGGQDGAAPPDRVFTLRRGDDLQKRRKTGRFTNTRLIRPLVAGGPN